MGSLNKKEKKPAHSDYYRCPVCRTNFDSICNIYGKECPTCGNKKVIRLDKYLAKAQVSKNIKKNQMAPSGHIKYRPAAGAKERVRRGLDGVRETRQ